MDSLDQFLDSDESWDTYQYKSTYEPTYEPTRQPSPVSRDDDVDAWLDDDAEDEFLDWFAGWSGKFGLSPDPGKGSYHYRKAWLAGVEPDESGHWPSEFKAADHPNRYVDGIDTITGEAADPLDSFLDSDAPWTDFQEAAPPFRGTTGLLPGGPADEPVYDELGLPITEYQPDPTKYDFFDRVKEQVDEPEDVLDIVPFVAGGKEITEMAFVAASAYRLDDGTATEEDVNRLREFLAQANKDTTFGYKVLDTVVQMPAFMGEFLLTGGIYTAGKKATTKGISKVIKKYLGETGQKLLEKNAVKLGISVAAGTVGATLQTPVMGLPRIIAGTIERTMPELALSEDENAVIAGKGEDLLPAMLKSFGDQWAETVSEHSGGLFGELGGMAKNAAIRTGLFKAFVKANPAKSPGQVVKLFKKMGYHGVINEMAEERLGEVLRAGTGVEDEYKLPTAEQLMVELVSFSVPGVVQVIGQSVATQKKVKEAPPSEPPPTAPDLDEIRSKFEAGEFKAEDFDLIKGLWSDDADLIAGLDEILKPPEKEVEKPTGAVYTAQEKRQVELEKEFERHEKELADAETAAAKTDQKELDQAKRDELKLTSEKRQKIIEDEFAREIEVEKQEEKIDAELATRKQRAEERVTEAEARKDEAAGKAAQMDLKEISDEMEKRDKALIERGIPEPAKGPAPAPEKAEVALEGEEAVKPKMKERRKEVPMTVFQHSRLTDVLDMSDSDFLEFAKEGKERDVSGEPAHAVGTLETDLSRGLSHRHSIEDIARSYMEKHGVTKGRKKFIDDFDAEVGAEVARVEPGKPAAAEAPAKAKAAYYLDKDKIVMVDKGPQGNYTFYRKSKMADKGTRIRGKKDVKYWYDTKEEAQAALDAYAKERGFEAKDVRDLADIGKEPPLKAKGPLFKEKPKVEKPKPVVKALAEVPHKKGSEAKTYLGDNTEVDFEYVVVDIVDIVTSHDDGLVKNPDFPEELQPRERDRKAMRAQVGEIVNKLNPERLGESTSASMGAPIVGNDLVVESGNGRAIALRTAYSKEKSSEYETWLADNAEKFGLKKSDIDGIEKPVLVRLRKPKGDRVEFVKKANQDEVARMSPTEQAKSDAERLTQADISIFEPSSEGNIATAANDTFIKRFMARLGTAEVAGYTLAGGGYTKQLVDRIQAAVFYKAYEDEFLLTLQAEEADPNVKNVLNALTVAAPEFVKARNADAALGNTEIVEHIVGAAKVIQRTRAQNIPVEDYFNQITMFEEVPEHSEKIARIIDINKRSAKKQGLFFRHMAKVIREGIADQKNMGLPGFEKSVILPGDIIDSAIAKLEELSEEKQRDLFGQRDLPGRVRERGRKEGEPGVREGRDAHDMARTTETIQRGYDQVKEELDLFGEKKPGQGTLFPTPEEPKARRARAKKKVKRPPREAQLDLFTGKAEHAIQPGLFQDFVKEPVTAAKKAPEQLPERTSDIQGAGRWVALSPTGRVFSAPEAVAKDAGEVASILKSIGKQTREALYTVTVDRDGNILEIFEHSKGDKSSATAHPIEIAGHILNIKGADTVYFVHNHPSGDVVPSTNDTGIDLMIGNILELGGIKSKGIIIGGNKWRHIAPQPGISELTIDISPVTGKDKIAVLETIWKGEAAGEGVSNSNDFRRILKDKYNSQEGFVFFDSKNFELGFLPWPAGKTVKDAAAQLLAVIEHLNAAAYAINLNKPMSFENRGGFVGAFGHIFEKHIQLHEIMEQGVSWADMGLIKKGVFQPKSFPSLQLEGTYQPATFQKLFAETVLMSTAAEKNASVSTKKVLETIIPILKTWTNFPVVRVVNTVDELPRRLRKSVDAAMKVWLKKRDTTGKVEGFYDPQTDQVYLIASNLSEGRIEDVLRHEAEGHRGLRILMGSALDGFLDKVAESKMDELLKVIPGLNVKDKNAVRYAANEWAARQIEAGIMKPLWHGRLIYAFRVWLRNFIPNLKLSDNDIKNVLYDVVLNVREGRPVAVTKSQKATALASEKVAKWHSQMEKVLKQKLQSKGTPEAYIQTIESFVKKGHFKQEELEWSGVLDWLRNYEKFAVDKEISKETKEGGFDPLGIITGEVQKKARAKLPKELKVSKPELLAFMAMDNVRIEEVLKGEKDYAVPEITSEEHAELNKLLKEVDYLGFDNLTLAKAAIAQNVDWAERWDVVYGDPKLIELGDKLHEKTNELVISESKFGKYVLPGGKEYRELLLTMPKRDRRVPSLLDYLRYVHGNYESVQDFKDTHPTTYKSTKEDYEFYLKDGTFPRGAYDEAGIDTTGYKPDPSHWDEPNVLAHIRFDERTGPNGEKILHIAEIQSDWHQEGRKKGYAGERKLPEGYSARKTQGGGAWVVARPDGVGVGLFGNTEQAAIDAYFDSKAGIPDAPFKKTWPLLTIKRMVRYAAENGFDAVSWDTGEVQAGRYDLSQHIEELRYFKHEDGTYDLSSKPKDANRRVFDIGSNIKEDELEKYIGKGLTEKIVAGYGEKDKGQGKWRAIKGLDLKVGGEGMKSFYDKLLPNVVNKFFNKAAWGKAKVGTVEIFKEKEVGEEITIPLLEDAIREAENADDGKSVVFLQQQIEKMEHGREYSYALFNPNEPASQYVQKVRRFKDKTVRVHALPITPEMKTRAIHEGMPLFSIKKGLTDKERAFLKEHYPGKLKQFEQAKDQIAWDRKGYDFSTEGLKDMVANLYAKFVMQEYPTERLARLAGEEEAEAIRLQIRRLRGKGGIVESALTSPESFKALEEDGITEYSDIEKSLSDILKPLESGEEYKDYEQLRVAEREVALARFRPDIKHINAEQARLIIDMLETKYGEDLERLRSVSKEHRDFERQAILRPLVKSGWMSQETYDNIVNRPEAEYYASFLREMEGVDRQVVSGGKDPLKRIYGSEKKKIPSVEGTIANLQKTVKLVETLRLNKMVVELRNVSEEMAEIIQEKPPNWIPVKQVLSAEVDPKLKKEIDVVVSSLGATTETLKSIGARKLGLFKQYLGSLGVSSQMDDEIMLKFATTEKTYAHELGHLIDARFNLINKLIMGKGDKLATARKKELRFIADTRAGEGVTDYYRKYIRKREEQVAEFVARYLTDKEWTRINAPESTRVLEVLFNGDTRLKPMLDMRHSGQAALDHLSDVVFARSPIPPKGTITVAVNGNKRYFTVPQDVERALDYYTSKEIHIVMKLISIPARLLRAGATLSFEFMARNPVRDQFTAFVYSKYGYNPFLDFGRGLFNLLGKTDLYKEYKAAGGEQSYFVSLDRQSTSITAKNLVGYKRKGRERFTTYNPIEGLRMISEWMEKGTRLGLYGKAKRKGATPMEAMSEAREGTLDFGRVGSQGKAINQITAFWNANVQGIDKMRRAFTENPGRTTLKCLLGITLPSIILWFLNHDDERYKALPDWQKNFFWIIPIGDDGPIIRIPKPFELGIIFGSLPERILDYIFDNDPKHLKSIAKAIQDGALPTIIPTVALPYIEHKGNYSFFRERRLESLGIQRLPEGMRFTPYTTELAKKVGKATDISPIKLENWVRNWGGTLASEGMRYMDVFLEDDLVSRVDKKWYEATPGLKGFIARDPIGGASVDVEHFYNNLKEVSEAEAGYKALNKHNRKEALKWFEKYKVEIKTAGEALRVSKTLAALRKEINHIIDAPGMTSEEKRERVDVLSRKITEKARYFNNYYAGKKR